MFQWKINKYIEEKALFGLHDKVLVALSGGADSVALLRVLLSLGYACEAAHCNFHLRGRESDRDERFVRSLCEALGVTLHVVHFDTAGYAAKRRVSIEMAARELRYEWFGRLRRERNAEVVAVAHHRDDSVETFLLNLVRGTGINGLKGIAARNGRIVRPLLEASRDDILAYLGRLGQEYVTDSTNLQDEYMRNKIRLRVLPLLRELNPSVSGSIAETAERLADVSLVYGKEMRAARRRVVETEAPGAFRICIAALRREAAPSSLLFEVLHPLGFNSRQVKEVFRSLSGQSGRRFVSAGWEVLRDREYVLVRRTDGAKAGNGADGGRAGGEPPELRMERVERTPGFVIPRDKEVACLDADKLALPLVVRKWRQGDRFVPFGMTGKKKVSDYLTDRKFSLFDKERQYVVCSGDEIVWLVGERSDNRFRVTDETRNVLILRARPGGNE